MLSKNFQSNFNENISFMCNIKAQEIKSLWDFHVKYWAPINVFDHLYTLEENFSQILVKIFCTSATYVCKKLLVCVMPYLFMSKK